ncbi:uncharacterized protein STAUR_3938 [Stigmatella aurantiaca DW4/3-1]|uniref:Uncharacterized protein n=1 Tax=Stigmatella aurantiaca (strain DW4/3-1) TaxID=378806 RepID=E3FJP7_STIAD|nr:uncharacterized protein STAUR_3938 [Stigmatella aurantiaca DW4/3-1]
MVDDVCLAEVEGKQVKRPHQRMVEDLVLEEDITLGDVLVVVAVRGDERQAALPQGVGQHPERQGPPDPRPSPDGQPPRARVRGESAGHGVEQGEHQEQVGDQQRGQKPHEDLPGLEAGHVPADVQEQQGAAQGRGREHQPQEQAPGAQSHDALLDVLALATHLVVVQVELAPRPGVHAQLAEPGHPQQEVLEPEVVPEIEVVKEIVLDLVDDGEGQRHQRNGQPPGEVSSQIKRSDQCHRRQAGQKEAQTHLALVLEPGVPHPEAVLFLPDGVVDAVGARPGVLGVPGRVGAGVHGPNVGPVRSEENLYFGVG